MTLATLALANCATAPASDETAPAVITEALGLTCQHLLDASTPPSRSVLERHGWRQFMTRGDALPPVLAGRDVDPALAGYRRTFGATGDVIASYWEHRCYGIASFDLAADSEASQMNRAREILAAIGDWGRSAIPEARQGGVGFEEGVRPCSVWANPEVILIAYRRPTGAVEWSMTRVAKGSNGGTPIGTSKDTTTYPNCEF